MINIMANYHSVPSFSDSFNINVIKSNTYKLLKVRYIMLGNIIVNNVF